MSPLPTLAASNPHTEPRSAITNHDTTVTTQETYSALKKTNGVLDTSEQTAITKDTSDSLQAASAGATLTIPKDATKGVTLPGNGIAVSLPNAKQATKGTTVANGTVAYAGTNGSANVVQANADGSVRMLTVIDNPAAPTSYSYNLTLPQGARLQLEPDGSVTVRLPQVQTQPTSAAQPPTTGTTLATIDKPWAKDANNK